MADRVLETPPPSQDYRRIGHHCIYHEQQGRMCHNPLDCDLVPTWALTVKAAHEAMAAVRTDDLDEWLAARQTKGLETVMQRALQAAWTAITEDPDDPRFIELGGDWRTGIEVDADFGVGSFVRLATEGFLRELASLGLEVK